VASERHRIIQEINHALAALRGLQQMQFSSEDDWSVVDSVVHLATEKIGEQLERLEG
jgi:hypothetical protein